MIRHPHVTAAVLMGGEGSRLGGADKSALSLGADPADTPLARALRLFTGRFPLCLLVTAPGRHAPPVEVPAELEVRLATDRIPGCGPIGGLEAALRAASTSHVFVCACDMPSLSGPLIDVLIERARPGRALVPVRSGRPEPLHAVYAVSSLPLVERAVEEGERMMLDLLARIPVDYLPESDYSSVEGARESFTNINTPEDLRRTRA